MSDNVISISDLRKEIEKGHKLFKAYEKGLEIIPMLEGLNQRAIELQAKVDALVNAAEQLAKENAVVKEKNAKLAGREREIVQAAEGGAEEIRKAAVREAEEIRKKAIDAAEDVSKKIEAADGELRETKAKIAAAQKDLEKLEKQKAETLKKMKAILGDNAE